MPLASDKPSAKYPVTTGKFVSLRDGLDIHYQVSGRGPQTVLFVPGWTMTSDVFCRQLEFFEGSQDYRFICFDPRAHGHSTVTHDGHTYEQHGRDLQALIEKLNLEDFVICGWSFGTLTMLAYIDQFGPQKLRGLIMLDGPPQACAANLDEQWATYSHDDADGSQEFFTMGKLRDPQSTNLAFSRWMLEDPQPQALEWIIGMTEQTPVEAAALLNASSVFLNYTETLISTAQSVPVWCAMREKRGERVTRWCDQHIPNARVSAFGEHMMFFERHNQFNRELMEFLKTC